MKQKNRVLQEENQSLKMAVLQVENASKTKSAFLSHMSHDIRTPMNGIIGMTGIAIKNFDDKERVFDCLKKIDSATKHLLSLVNDILDMSRIESGRMVINHEPMDMREVITAIRTGVVLVMAWLIVLIKGKQSQVKTIDQKEISFIFFSGITTGASWLCYYYAIQNGIVSVVVPIDKLSIVVTVAFSYLVLKEKLTRKAGLGLCLMVCGMLIITI